ncbi:hypothetical protein ACFLYY_02540 [Patescibacteria group bacterium]
MLEVKWVNYHHGYHLLEVDTKKLASVAWRQRVIKPKKLSTLVKKIKAGEEIYAPIVVKRNLTVIFLDGIHTTIATDFFGLLTIKIAVLPEEEDFIQNYFSSTRVRLNEMSRV